MINEEKYRNYQEEIRRLEEKYPLLIELDRHCPHKIRVEELERRLEERGVNLMNVVEYYHMKNLLALHDDKNLKDNKYKKEVRRTHLIARHLERHIVGFPVEKSH